MGSQLLGSLLAQQDSEVLTSFAAILVNFSLALPCGTCSHNFDATDPVLTLTHPLLLTRDPVTRIYELHNRVNLHKDPPSEPFKFEDFLQKYNLKLEYSKYQVVEELVPI